MKIFKQIFLGLFVAIVFAAAAVCFIHPKRVLAATQPLTFYYGACVDKILLSNGSHNCTFFDNSNLPDPHLLYANQAGEISVIQSAIYKIPYEANANYSKNPPDRIVMVDPVTKNTLVLNNNTQTNNLYTNFIYSTGGLDAPETKAAVYIYRPGKPATRPGEPSQSNFALLVTLSTNGQPPKVMALVNDSVQPATNGDSRGTVYAYKINKLATLTNTDGSLIVNASDSEGGTACEDNNHTGFEWLFCGVLRGVDDFVNRVIGFIEDQLNFDVKANLIEPEGIKQAWNSFRIISSILLVLIMLVMIFSQAVSIGPFDAYTVRKLLPKLVAAVILIQISWFASIWLVRLANSLGNGMADLMSLPFGGTEQLSFQNLVSHLGPAAPGALITGGLLAGLAAGLINPFGALMVAFIVFMGVVTALAVLLVRQALIIACIILMPLALVAWILPGTQKYFRILWDNFLRALLLFPIIVALLYLGRVFAWVVGVGGGEPGILDFLAIIVGFFGPLFLLPRAFRWGGTIISTASGAINSAMQPVNKAGRECIKGMGERYQGAAGKKYNPNAHWSQRALRRIQSGHFIPPVYGLRGASERSRRLTIASGDKWQADRDEEALALIKRKGETVMRDGYSTIRRDENGDMIDANKKKTTDVNAATKQLTGVQAMKQMWVDLAEDGRDTHEKKMAIRQLTATASWPEIQGAFTRSGNRVIDTDAWASAITTSPEDYPRVLRSRVDAAPHITNSADVALAEENKSLAALKRPILTGKAANDFKSQHRIQYAIEKQMSNEDFATQSDGFWEETARMATLRDSSGNLTQGAINIQKVLRNRLTAIHDIGGTAPQQLLGHLVGGSVQGSVDKALGPGMNVRDYVSPGPLGGSTSKAAVKARWDTTIPQPADLANPTTRAEYKTNLLTITPGARGTIEISPAAKVLAEGLAYNAGDKSEQINLLNELKFSAAASPEATNAYNAVVDEIHSAYDRRAKEIVARAVATRTTPVEVERIRVATEAAANNEKATFTKI
jgi:hypothetical protein